MGRIGYFTNNSHGVLSGAKTLESVVPSASYSISIIYGVRGRLEALDSAGNVVYAGTFYTLQPVGTGTYEMQFTDSGLAWDVSGLYVCVNIQVDDTGTGSWSDNRWCWTFTEDQGAVLDGGTVFVWVEKVDDPVLGQYYNVRYGGTYDSRYDMIYTQPVNASYVFGRQSSAVLDSVSVSITAGFTAGRDYPNMAYARFDRSAAAQTDYVNASVTAGYSFGRTATARLDYVTYDIFAQYWAGRISSAKLSTWFLTADYIFGRTAAIPERQISAVGRSSRMMSFLVEVLKSAGFTVGRQAVVPEKTRSGVGSASRNAKLYLELFREASYAVGRASTATLDSIGLSASFTVGRLASAVMFREFLAAGRGDRQAIVEALLEQIFEALGSASRAVNLDMRVFDYYIECAASRRSRIWGGRRTGCGRLV